VRHARSLSLSLSLSHPPPALVAPTAHLNHVAIITLRPSHGPPTYPYYAPMYHLEPVGNYPASHEKAGPGKSLEARRRTHMRAIYRRISPAVREHKRYFRAPGAGTRDDDGHARNRERVYACVGALYGRDQCEIERERVE
jgi:hypothetical protein